MGPSRAPQETKVFVLQDDQGRRARNPKQSAPYPFGWAISKAILGNSGISKIELTFPKT
jgi:hypothetical protein